jgi:hypothetical protein
MVTTNGSLLRRETCGTFISTFIRICSPNCVTWTWHFRIRRRLVP